MNIKSKVLLIITISLISGCSPNQGQLTIVDNGVITWQSETGEKIVTRFYSLSDSSLEFVKVILPNGEEYTLPQVVSASGVRYTDEREIVFWMKGETAFVQHRALDGEWQILYDNCRMISKR
ncbi:MAG TPA: MliC family protein [Candidatus Marinimicrobia bacterium]|nr:MliC family protein [Candidatus Neomarinimicrobiota bacterium]HRS51722.1 MliC family protein [Candidatus Neomarinimicrobiota bacterium]HRU92128.1 MliC family protein [Candidatus Neomarinimicrobiota bacterium]